MITLRDKDEIEILRRAGEIVGETHHYLEKFIKPGITTKELDKLAYDFIISKDATPSFLNLYGFPGTICTSINEEVVHGIPGPRKLRNGDIITIDIVACYKGYHGDSAWTYAVGTIDDKKKYMMEHTEKALFEGLKMVKPGNRVGDISHAIEKYATDHHMGVVRELVGHGVGTDMHEDPEVPNYGHAGQGPLLKEGMVIAVEPMLTYGDRHVCILDDDWTIVTADGEPSAHYEHTIVVTKDGYEILTKR